MSTTNTRKQDERHLKILRNMLSLQENKVCMDCPAKGPTYVNLFNHTFVCTRCSGLLRNLEFRVKSVSASTFTPDEIKALQEGGNEVGRRVWLASYKPSDFATPGIDDTNRILEFMRLKYQGKRWFSEEQRHLQHSLAQQQLQQQPYSHSQTASADVSRRTSSAAFGGQNNLSHDLFGVFQQASATQNPAFPPSDSFQKATTQVSAPTRTSTTNPFSIQPVFQSAPPATIASAFDLAFSDFQDGSNNVQPTVSLSRRQSSSTSTSFQTSNASNPFGQSSSFQTLQRPAQQNTPLNGFSSAPAPTHPVAGQPAQPFQPQNQVQSGLLFGNIGGLDTTNSFDSPIQPKPSQNAGSSSTDKYDVFRSLSSTNLAPSVPPGQIQNALNRNPFSSDSVGHLPTQQHISNPFDSLSQSTAQQPSYSGGLSNVMTTQMPFQQPFQPIQSQQPQQPQPQQQQQQQQQQFGASFQQQSQRPQPQQQQLSTPFQQQQPQRPQQQQQTLFQQQPHQQQFGTPYQHQSFPQPSFQQPQLLFQHQPIQHQIHAHPTPFSIPSNNSNPFSTYSATSIPGTSTSTNIIINTQPRSQAPIHQNQAEVQKKDAFMDLNPLKVRK